MKNSVSEWENISGHLKIIGSSDMPRADPTRSRFLKESINKRVCKKILGPPMTYLLCLVTQF